MSLKILNMRSMKTFLKPSKCTACSTTAETTDNGDAALRITLNLQGGGEAVSPAGSELGDGLRLNEVLDMLDNAESPGAKKRPHDSPPGDATLVDAFLDGLTD